MDDDAELQNEFLLTAIALFEGEDIDGQTAVGDLYLRNDDGAWRVHRMMEDGGLVYLDSIWPAGFGSARILASYLLELNGCDAERVDLPSDASDYVGARL